MSDAPLAVRAWLGESHFRVLGHYFRLRWEDDVSARSVTRVLGGFQVNPEPLDLRNPATPNVPPVYSIVHAEPDQQGGWELWYGDSALLTRATLENTLGHLFWHINAETARLTGSYLLLHAGAVSTPSGNGLILPGDSGAGKSTVVTGLVRAGFGYFSDEAAAIDPVSRRLYPYPKAINLKSGSLDLFPDLAGADEMVVLGDQWLIPPSVLQARKPGRPCEVRWIVTVRHTPDAVTELAEISRASAVLQLSQHAINLPQYGSRALPLLADVARGARSYRLVTGDVAEAVSTLERLTAGAGKMA